MAHETPNFDRFYQDPSVYRGQWTGTPSENPLTRYADVSRVGIDDTLELEAIKMPDVEPEDPQQVQ